MKRKLLCPICRGNLPLEIEEQAVCSGVWIKCKHCRRVFQLLISGGTVPDSAPPLNP